MTGTPITTSPLLVIAGPTAVGKSKLALSIAENVDGEILSIDSRQLLRGFNVGTAKPSAVEQNQVLHHGVGVTGPECRWSSGRYREFADNAITTALQRGNPIVAVGGSTLYVDALVRGLPDAPPVPDAIQQEIAGTLSVPNGPESLYEELVSADPDAAKTLDVTKTHRLARWVGVLRATGVRPSVLWATPKSPPLPSRLIILDRPRGELYERINARVDTMIGSGLVEEVRLLATSGDAVRENLASTIGYRELLPVIEDGASLVDAIESIKRNTRRYAKRQLTWFRRYDEGIWLDARTATVDSVLQVASPWPAER